MENLREHYSGFYIVEPVGNNSFSYTERRQKQIFVPPIIEGGLDDLEIGERIAFSEVCEGKEVNSKGLKHFVRMTKNGKHIFIFDNHNHAFFFWMHGLKSGKLKKGLPLVHVDQHSDLREPKHPSGLNPDQEIDPDTVFKYTNEVLTVSDFIRPAMDLKIFSRFEKIDGEFALNKDFDEEIVLDVDVDIFTKEMNCDNHDFYIERIRQYINTASFLTIATSPYFIDQNEAIKIVRELLK
jgi:hypothetical protein